MQFSQKNPIMQSCRNQFAYANFGQLLLLIHPLLIQAEGVSPYLMSHQGIIAAI